MRIFLSPPHQTGTELQFLQEALDSNYLAPTGPMLARFEAEIRERSGRANALALNTGTSAIHLAIRHLIDHRHPREDPRRPLVLASSLTFVASVAPAVQLGCEVRLIDAEHESWTMDPVLLSHALQEARSESRQVLCVVPTDLYGQRCDLKAIIGLCEPAGIPVLSDAAEAMGAKDLEPLSPRPWAEVYSFNGNKIITASAGGALVSDDDLLVHHARKLSMQAREDFPHYEHRELGYNYRMSNLLAAVGLAQLQKLDERVAQRRIVFEGYRQRLAQVPGITLMPEAAWNRCTRWLTVILVDEDAFGASPREIRKALEAAGIESRPMWKPLHAQPALAHLRFYDHGVADTLFQRGLCLPSGSALTDANLDEVCGIILGTR